MSVWHFSNSKGEWFTRKPVAVKSYAGKGWIIQCHSNNTGLYGGHYVKYVGWADQARHGHIAFRLKRDAVAAIEAGRKLGLFTE